MPFKKSTQPLRVTDAPRCLYLRAKSMYVRGAENMADTDGSAGAACWCARTQHVVGPDRLDVDRLVCIPGRDCFEPAG
jgi:hypothetical protein